MTLPIKSLWYTRRGFYDILEHHHIQCHQPPSITTRVTHDHVTELDHFTEFDYQILGGFYRTNNKGRLLLQTPGPVLFWDLYIFHLLLPVTLRIELTFHQMTIL